mgnify:FL=1
MMFSIDDLIFIAILLWLLLISVLVLRALKNKEDIMSSELKSKRDMIDLERITKNIEKDYKPANINLTSYEQEQEANAIISYQELLNSKDKNHVNYDNGFNNKTDINVKKVDLSNNSKNDFDQSRINVSLMSYEKEEAFLKALKQLKIDLAMR